MSNNAKNDVVARIQAFIAGLQKNQTGQTLVLAGSTITVTALIAELEGYIAQLNATTAARAAWAAQVQTTRTMDATQMTPLLTALQRYLEGIYGPSSSVLADYGMKPSKPAKRTLQSKVTAAEKDAATRLARHTEGPREKEAIHGTVPPAASNPPATTPPATTPPATTPPASSPQAPQVNTPSSTPTK